MDLTTLQPHLFPPERPQASLTVPVSMMALGGEHDFAGGMSLMVPTRQRATVRLARRSDDVLQIALASGPHPQYLRLPGSLLTQALDTPRALGPMVAQQSGGEAALPFVAVLRTLVQQAGLAPQGLDLWLSWSQDTALYPALCRALQTALVIALNRHAHLGLEGRRLPLLAWQAARQYGDPVGPHDFLASFTQQPEHLLPILPQPDLTYPPLSLVGGPYPVAIQLAAPDYQPDLTYRHQRAACAMGLALLAQRMGASAEDLQLARDTDERAHLPLEGQLCRLSVAEYERRYRAHLPAAMSGGDFLRMGVPIPDPAVSVHPYRSYPVQAATTAAVYANERQSHCLGLLRQLNRQPDPAAYAALRHSFSDLTLYHQPQADHPMHERLLARIESISPGLGVIGLVPVRPPWERAFTLWLKRPLPLEAAATLLPADLPGYCLATHSG